MYQLLLSPYARGFYNEWGLYPKRADYNIVFDQELNINADIDRLEEAIKRLISDNVLLNSHSVDLHNNLFCVPNKKVELIHYVSRDISSAAILNSAHMPFSVSLVNLGGCYVPHTHKSLC